MTDRLYTMAGYLAGLFAMGTLLAVLASIVGRLTRLDAAGADAYAGYCMAAAAFLALAPTLRRGEHIRVSLIMNRLGAVAGRWLDIVCHALGMLLAGALAWYSLRLVWQSYVFHDISTGMDATPLWIPQIGMAAGTGLFWLAITEDLIALLRGRSLRATGAAGEPAHIE